MTDASDFEFDDDADDRVFDATLSVSGLSRRAQILQTACAAARRKRLRRRTTQGATIVLVACVAALSVMFAIHGRQKGNEIVRNPREPSAQPAVARTPDVAHPPTPTQVTWIKSEPGISERLAIPSQPIAWKTLTDMELMDALSGNGKPVALVYVDNRPALMLPGNTLH